jgi:hypothetical protein
MMLGLPLLLFALSYVGIVLAGFWAIRFVTRSRFSRRDD